MTTPIRFPHAPYADAADFAIGLRPIQWDAWFEPGEAAEVAARRKAGLLALRPERVWAELEGSRPAQAEAGRLVFEALGRTPPVTDRAPLLEASLAVADDLCLMERRAGAWTLTALSLSAGTFFTAEEAIGKNLETLHGPVPGFAARFLGRVARIFDNLPPDRLLERRNWTVLNSAEPHLPDPAPVRSALADIAPEAAGAVLFLRVERQTLRRLPETDAALFTIRVWTQSLDELAGEPERLAAFAAAWRQAEGPFRQYKQLHLYDSLVEGVLTKHLA